MTLVSLMESGDVGKMEYRKTRRVAHLSAFEILVHFMGLGREDFVDPIQFCLQINFEPCLYYVFNLRS